MLSVSTPRRDGVSKADDSRARDFLAALLPGLVETTVDAVNLHLRHWSHLAANLVLVVNVSQRQAF